MLGNSAYCQLYDEPPVTYRLMAQTFLVTAFVVIGFTYIKTALDNLQKKSSRIRVVVIGAGPIGLTSAVIALKSGKSDQIAVYDEQTKYDLIIRNDQLSFDNHSIIFLKRLGIDFHSIEGCWSNNKFSTRAGLYLEHVLNILARFSTVKLNLHTKFTRENRKGLELRGERQLVIICDGVNGITSRMFGLNDDVIQHSCHAYGAAATLDRFNQLDIPKSDKCVNKLNFDIGAYGKEMTDTVSSPGFHFRLVGTPRNRYMTLSVPKSNNKLLKTLRTVLDRSIIRNIFVKCFNTYKPESEPLLGAMESLNRLKHSPRLFEIKLFQRTEIISYFEETNMFVLCEGDASLSLNFYTGMNINIGLRSIDSLKKFIEMAASCKSEHSIVKTLNCRTKEYDKLCSFYLREGLRRIIFN